MSNVSERDLDRILENAFKTFEEFSAWFLGKTKFSPLSAKYCWSRSDNPWGRVPHTKINPETGLEDTAIRDSETDVLVVFEYQNGRKVALHIENKLAAGHFTDLQPEYYEQRARYWLNNSKYGSYEDFETVLVAPCVFYKKWQDDCQKFDRYVSHEEIADFLPEFRSDGDRR